jgi:hypothetical protein
MRLRPNARTSARGYLAIHANQSKTNPAPQTTLLYEGVDSTGALDAEHGHQYVQPYGHAYEDTEW